MTWASQAFAGGPHLFQIRRAIIAVAIDWRSARDRAQFCCLRRYFRNAVLWIAVIFAANLPHLTAFAQDATWAGATSDIWNTGSNWSSGTVPNGTAIFSGATPTSIIFSASSTSIGTLQFNSGAPAYNFTISAGQALTIDGGNTGIVNNSSFAPVFTNSGTINFENSASAGNASIGNYGSITFSNGTAGFASITNNIGGTTTFYSNSSAASATIKNDGGTTIFQGSNVNAGNATIITNQGGATYFYDNAGGGNARFITNSGGVVDFSGVTSGGIHAVLIAGAGTYNLGNVGLILNLPASTTVSGTINDSGASGGTGASLYLAFDHLWTDTFAVLGLNTYSGGTTIDRGTLAVAFGSQLGTNYSSVGTGTVTLLNATFKNVSGGALVFANNFQINPTYLGVPGGTFDTSGGDITITGQISSRGADFGQGTITTGSLALTGGGSLILSGTNTYTGATTVKAGTLIVTGDISSSSGVTVNPGAALAGTGIVPEVTVNAGGTFAPGTSGAPGTLKVAGNLAFESGATYLVRVNATTASLANISGTAALAGTVDVVFAPGSYITNQYTILHTGGLAGTFSGLNGDLPAGFSDSLRYTATDVILTLMGQLGTGGGLDQNEQDVASAINNFFNRGGALPPNFVAVFGLTGSNLKNALTLLSGEAATGSQQAAFQLMGQFLGIMLDPFVDGRRNVLAVAPALGFAPERETLPEDIALAYANVMKAQVYKAPPAPFEQRWTVWFGAFGGYNRTSGDPVVVGSHDLTAAAGGVAAGLDYHVTRDTVVGAALAGGATNWGLAQSLGGGRSNAFQAGTYAATRWGPAFLEASLAFANHWASTDRFAAFGDHLTASFNAQSLGARLESGYRLGTPAGGITPYAAVQAQAFRTPFYSETDVTSGGFALSYNPRTATDARSELGARFGYMLAVSSAVLTLRGRLAWAHDWVSDPSLAAAFQALLGPSFIVNGATPAHDSALASAGAELRFANGVTLLGKFDGEFAGRSNTYAGTGAVRVTW